MAALCKNTEIDVTDALIIVLIVAEEDLYEDLPVRQLTALYVRRESLISEPEQYTMLNQTLMIRCAVARFFNHCGYDRLGCHRRGYPRK